MIKRLLLTFLSAGCSLVYLQAQDSLLQKTRGKADSAYQYQTHAVDSIQKSFHHRTDSVQRAFASPVKKLQGEIDHLSHKKDSLSRLNLPTQSVTHKIDSLQQAKTSKVKEMNASVEKIKKESLSKVNSLHLPPQAQGEVDKLSKSISGYSVPTNFFQLPNTQLNTALKIPGMNLPGVKVPSLNLPSNLSIPSANIPSLQKLNLNTQLPSLEKYKQELSQVTQLKSKVNEKELEKLALKEAAQVSGMKELQGQEGKLADVKSQLDQVKEAKPEQVTKMAVNHFAGKEQELKSAMDQVSKYKQKYSSVKSLAELPKRPPNPLKDKPWIERVVPGVNYYIQFKQTTLVDVNPYLTWRFDPHLSVAVGWNQRIGIRHGHFGTAIADQVYGPRIAASYLWQHGFVFRLAPEVMNAQIPQAAVGDPSSREWVWGVFAGIRKDFTIYKSIKGYSEVLYNFVQHPKKNLYGDQVSFRLGIEVMLKKKQPKKK